MKIIEFASQLESIKETHIDDFVDGFIPREILNYTLHEIRERRTLVGIPFSSYMDHLKNKQIEVSDKILKNQLEGLVDEQVMLAIMYNSENNELIAGLSDRSLLTWYAEEQKKKELYFYKENLLFTLTNEALFKAFERSYKHTSLEIKGKYKRKR